MIASLLQVSKHFIIQSSKEKPESQCSDQSTDDSGFWLCQEHPIINDDGVITGNKVGVTTVHAAAGLDTDHQIVCNMNVHVSEPYIPAVYLRTDMKEASLAVGETTILQAEVFPETATYRDVQFSSSDPSVAAVEPDGTIKGISAGSATIKVTHS